MSGTRTILVLAAGTLGLMGVAATAGAGGDPVESRGGAAETEVDAEGVLVRPSVLLEHRGTTPGGTVWAAVRFEIKPGWHTYWPGQNETGSPTEILVNGPDGLRVGPVLWPPPKRYISPGDILDHAHEGIVTALVPVTLPADAVVGETVDVAFDLSWLACQEVCIPGWETVRVGVAVRGHGAGEDSASAGPGAAEVFASARARLPEPVSATERIAKIHWENNTAVIRVRGAYKLAFYPGVGGSRVEDLLRCGEMTGDTLRLPVRVSGEAGARAGEGQKPTLMGLLEVFSPDGISRVYEVRSKKPAG